jgi:predicted MFS family arabinose efflux permease
MGDAQVDASDKPQSPYARPGYRWYVLGMLTLVYTFNFVDRQVLVILQEQIRAELQLMDWQLGLLSGLAFAVFYSILGLPIAHYSEVLGRKRVVSIALAFWSAMTALSGAAQNFVHLLLIRIGVGVGEAGGSPPSHSMISDIFPRRRRALALSIFSMGVYFGYLVAYSIGGWVAADLGWRWTFVVVGLPGILLALIVAATIREPDRGLAERIEAGAEGAEEPADDGRRPDFGETMRSLWSRRSFRHLSLACSLHSIVGYGVGNFVPSFVMRAHDMPIGELGWRLALITGLGGAAGVTVGGWLADRLARRSQNWYAWVSAISLVLTLPLTLLAFLARDIGDMWPAYIPYLMLSAFWLGPSIAVTHSLVGLRQRAVASAALFFILNLIGLGLGPLTVGTLSDLMRPDFGDADGLRYAIVGTALTANVWAIVHYLLAARTLESDVGRVGDPGAVSG